MTSYPYRVYIQAEKVEATDWEKFFRTISRYGKNFVLEIHFSENEIDFYLTHRRNLSHLSSGISPFILKPENKPAGGEGKERSYFLIIGKRKNILEIKEHEEVKSGKRLRKILWVSDSIFGFRFYHLRFYFDDGDDQAYVAKKLFFKNPCHFLTIDFPQLVKYRKKSVPLYLKIGDVSNLFVDDAVSGFMDIMGFPYLTNPKYLSLRSFNFDKHSLIVGQTGVGKSKLIELFIKELKRQRLEDQYAVVVIDPQAVLYSGFSNFPQATKVDFEKTVCDLFPQSSDPKIATELTILLFKTLLRDQFNAKMERVLKYSLYVLFRTGEMSLAGLKRFLTELEYRKTILGHINDLENIALFFGSEFAEIQTKFYESAIIPILVLIDELSFLPIFTEEKPQPLAEIIEKNFFTCLSLNRILLGEKATRLIAGLIIQQVFLLAQDRRFSRKIILIVDEVSLVENEALISILSEARKFNLSLFLSQQYLTQIQPELLKSVLSNVYNYFVFKVAEEDAKILGENLQMDFPDEILKSTKDKGGDEAGLKVKLMNALNPRECLVRIFANGRFYQCFKAKTLNI